MGFDASEVAPVGLSGSHDYASVVHAEDGRRHMPRQTINVHQDAIYVVHMEGDLVLMVGFIGGVALVKEIPVSAIR
jgi:hypothetical protein